MRAALTARALITGTAGLGGALLAIAVVESRSVSLGTLTLFGAAVFVTELFMVVPRDETSFDLRDTTSFTFSASVHIAAVLVLGPWAAALVAAWGFVAADGLRARPFKQIVFNTSASAVAITAGGFLFEALGGHPGSLNLPGDFPAVGALAVVVYGMVALLVTAVVALEADLAFIPTAREALITGLPASIGEAGLGVALAFFVLNEPWAAITLLPLVAAVYRSHERLVTLRRETAHALETFANVVDERDRYTYRHSDRVAEYVRTLAESLGLPTRTVAELSWAGRLHDLGKIAVDAAVLRKPGKLDEEEWALVRRHPRLSARLLRRFHLATDQAKAVEYHHERADGRGYYGVDPAEIPLAAHFLVVADSFDAMTSDRPYREALPVEVALYEIEANAGTQFHPAVAKAFVALQRGQDAAAALTREERAELRRMGGGDRQREIREKLDWRSETIFASAVVATLLGFGAGLAPLALSGALLALVVLGLRRLDAHRARRLAGGLRDALDARLPREALFSRLVSELGSAGDVGWTALVAWRERECSGSIEFQWHDEGCEAPNETSLMSWLVRETESVSGLLIDQAATPGRDRCHIAVPLRQEGALAGYLVFGIAGRLPHAVEEVLRTHVTPLAEGLLLPARGRATLRRLEAVAL